MISDVAAATAGQTTFLLSHAPGFSAVIMLIDGVFVVPSDFVVSGTVVTYAGSPLSTGQQVFFYYGIGLGGGIHETTISPPSIAANQNNFNPTGWHTATIVRLSSSGSFNITGFEAPLGEAIRKTLINVGGGTLSLISEDGSSLAANRIITSPGSGFAMLPNDAAELFYDSVSLRWRTI
jgi:hypothetical protein